MMGMSQDIIKEEKGDFKKMCLGAEIENVI